MDLVGLTLLLAAGLLACVLAATGYVVYVLTHPPRRGYAYATARGLAGDPSELGGVVGGEVRYEEWTFTSRGRQLPVWDVPGRDAAGPTVIVTHGWGDSRVAALSRLPALLAGSRRVVLWDLPGHGDAPGTCSLGTREVDDLLALIGRIEGEERVSGPGFRGSGSEPQTRAPTPGHPDTIVLYGYSLGAVVSIGAAARCAEARIERWGGDPKPPMKRGLGSPVAGVIAEAPYRVPMAPAWRVMRQAGLPYRVNLPLAMAWLGVRFGYGLTWCGWGGAGLGGGAGGFDRVEHARRVRVPLLVVHGTQDEVCPFEDGVAIAAAAPKGRLLEVAGAGHLDLWTDERFSAVCGRAVREFVQKASRDLGIGSRDPLVP